jgi:hypothetical protein
MKFPKILTGLLSTAILVGCGSDSDDEVTTPEIGAEYIGKTADAEITDNNKGALSKEIQAAVKAVTFVRYEENYSDYRYLYVESARLGNILYGILSAQSQQLQLALGDNTFSEIVKPSECVEGGSVILSGSYDDLSLVADNYCIPEEGVTYTISGGLTYKVDGDNHEISMDNISLEMDRGEAVDDYREISGSGDISYVDADNVSILVVNSTLSGLGLTVSSKVKQTCGDGCTYDAEVLSENGTVYRAEDLEVAVDSNGYLGSADFYLPNSGKVSVAFDDLQYCEDGSIGGGSIFVRSEPQAGELMISFNGCGVSPSNYYYADGIPPQA